MRDITEQAETLAMQVTSEKSVAGVRTVQVVITGPGGGHFKAQLDLDGDEAKWVSFPIKLIGNQVGIG